MRSNWIVEKCACLFKQIRWSSQDLKVGTLLLGCVKEVNDFEIVVGLPSGLTGYLPVTNISESYNKILSDQLDSGELVEV